MQKSIVYENLQVFRDVKSDGAMKKMKDAIDEGNTAADLGKSMFNILKSARKAELALELLELDQDPWPVTPPTYIREGLSWLQAQLRQEQQELLVRDESPAAQVGVTE